MLLLEREIAMQSAPPKLYRSEDFQEAARDVANGVTSAIAVLAS